MNRSTQAGEFMVAMTTAKYSAALLFALAIACTPQARAPELDTAKLIPRQLLFGNADRSEARLSPDGCRLSFLAPVDGVLNLWVAPIDNLPAAVPVTDDRDRGIEIYVWAYTSRHVLYLQDEDGDENWQVHVVDLEDGRSRSLTPSEGVSARIQARDPEFPEEILVALNDRDPELHDLYRVNFVSGERVLVEKNEGFAFFTTDQHFRVRLARRSTPDGGAAFYRRNHAGDWELFQSIPMEDFLTTWNVGFDDGGRTLYQIDSRGRNTSALVALDLDRNESTQLFADPRSDVVETLQHPRTHRVQAVATNFDRKSWVVLDPAIEADFSYLTSVADGDLQIWDRTLDDRHWLVGYDVSDQPYTYFYYDREARRATPLLVTQPELSEYRLAPMRSEVIRSRDGLDLVSYLTLPAGALNDRVGRPASPLPMVLWVHGGPWERDERGLHPIHQLFANRGYAVLGVNFRGSTGFGKDFLNASTHEWAGKMQTDLLDAVDWAVTEGIADPARVAIVGGSYGGYATLVGLTSTPDRFACGVDIVGPSNLITLLESLPEYWQPYIEMWASRVGDHRTEDGRRLLAERSPIHRVDRIRRPLLIGQGANDPRATRQESDQIVEAMGALGIPVTYVLYPDEGHGFARPENWLSFIAITEAFLADCLGGHAELIGDAFEGSSLQVLAGLEQVTGVAEALLSRGAYGQGDRP
ncbi:MAG: S9 family peptidase [Actinobacteria bacterium]|nr:S9 family peptidase [Actinomycetota bacterium]